MSASNPAALKKCGVAPGQQFRAFVAANVLAWIETCERAGLTHWDIAVRVGCHRTTVSIWKSGRAENMYAGAYVALQALATECAGRKAV